LESQVEQARLWIQSLKLETPATAARGPEHRGLFSVAFCAPLVASQLNKAAGLLGWAGLGWMADKLFTGTSAGQGSPLL